MFSEWLVTTHVISVDGREKCFVAVFYCGCIFDVVMSTLCELGHRMEHFRLPRSDLVQFLKPSEVEVKSIIIVYCFLPQPIITAFNII